MIGMPAARAAATSSGESSTVLSRMPATFMPISVRTMSLCRRLSDSAFMPTSCMPWSSHTSCAPSKIAVNSECSMSVITKPTTGVLLDAGIWLLLCFGT